MTDEDAADWTLPKTPMVDVRALRRARRRGIARTAAVGALYILVGLIALNFAGAGLQAALHRQSQMARVVQTGWQVAHPEFDARESGVATSGWSTSLSLTVAPINAVSAPGSTVIRFHENLFGSLNTGFGPAQTPATQVLLTFGQPGGPTPTTKADEKAFLLGLPKPTVSSAIVEFSSPLTEADYQSFLRRHDSDGALILGRALFSRATPMGAGFIRGVCGWSLFLNPPARGAADLVGSFRHWVNSLHGSDRGKLEQVGIDLDGLRAAARAGLIYGVIVSHENATSLLSMLNDQAVAAVHVVDVGFAVEGADNG